eukprot:2884620-Amphidinium_carterae.1
MAAAWLREMSACVGVVGVSLSLMSMAPWCPLELCPQQSAPEAEDYALYMLGRMCEPMGVA